MDKSATILWEPSAGFIHQSGLKKYERWLLEHWGLVFSNYDELWEWSNDKFEDFWESLWQYFEVISHSPYNQVINTHTMPGARWFTGATLNYAEHIFRNKTDAHPALVFSNENLETRNIDWGDLQQQVASVREFLTQQGVKKGDTVAGYLPNIPEAIIAFLAVNSLGAIWSCCAPDFGVQTVIDRFSQIEPKVLFAGNGYQYGGKKQTRMKEIKAVAEAIVSIKTTIIIPIIETGDDTDDSTPWSAVISNSEAKLTFEPVDFNHPIWVLYSSGTTGKPKAITHSHGGVLLEHLKYMHLQNDVHPGERFFWFTTTGWMMWNFLQAAMLAGATPVLYDGSPAYPKLDTLWQLAAELPIHHFGTSAPYLVACMKKGLKPGKEFDFKHLKSIGSTGAPLPPEAFDWVYESVSKNVWLCSMSGGTDVCTAFVGGIPEKPVIRGRIQGRALGCGLHSLGEDGNPITSTLGEMVITNPMPSMPVYFWGDENHERYKASYFEKFPGKWCHGDWIQLFEDGSLVIQGRSDATLNRKGIRIGTAEIYSVLDRVPGVLDALIVNLEQPSGVDIMPLFVKLDIAVDLNHLEDEIKSRLREECSPRHVPDQIIQVDDIPYTLSGKKMEVPVKKALMGMDITKTMNKDACRNPAAMNRFLALAAIFKS